MHGTPTDGPASPPDRLVMERVREGDTDMLEHLVRKYEKPLFSFTLRLLRNRSEAEDAFQETFLRIHQKRATYRSGMEFRPWLYRICLNVCRDALRRRSRVPESLACDVVDPSRGPADVSTDTVVADRIRLAVAALPDAQREVIVLHQYQGCPYLEIAEILEIPVGTVKSRVHYALARLARELEDLEVDRV